MAQRNLTSKRPRIAVRSNLYLGRVRLTVCLDCVTAKYGKAGSREPTLLATPLIGYRGWSLNSDGLLVSWWEAGFVWTPGGVQAQCTKKGNHRVPGPKCSCGLYALDTLNMTEVRGDVIGQVEYWGHFHRGDRGFRAEWGKPTALLCRDWHLADQIHATALIYKVPVTHSRKLLVSTEWGVLASLEGGDLTDEHWRREGGGRSPAAPSTSGTDGSPGRASCRTAAAGASDLAELKHMAREGLISASNVHELLDGEFDN